jgi:hypothetical protein
MYTLIALLTMTTLGSYPTQARCEAAVRQIYAQQLDPYNMMEPAAKKKVLALKMKYVAPREYRCQKV